MSRRSSSCPAPLGWTEIAYAWIREYAIANRSFISEECTQAAREAGVADPGDPRAWGGVFRRADSNGVIRRIGYAKSPLRHLSPTPLWESALYGGAQRDANDAPDQADHTAPVP